VSVVSLPFPGAPVLGRNRPGQCRRRRAFACGTVTVGVSGSWLFGGANPCLPGVFTEMAWKSSTLAKSLKVLGDPAVHVPPDAMHAPAGRPTAATTKNTNSAFMTTDPDSVPEIKRTLSDPTEMPYHSVGDNQVLSRAKSCSCTKERETGEDRPLQVP
jgi:hypothetical protein